MLKIGLVASPDEAVSLRLEGQIRGPWVEELRRSCTQALATGHGLILDRARAHFSDQASSRARGEVAICCNIFHRPAL